MGPADPAAAAVVADRGSLQAIGEAASGAVRRACEGLTHLSSCCRREALPAQDPLEAAQAERHRLQEQLLLAGSGPANQSPLDRVANAFATHRAQARLLTLDAEIPRLMDARLRQVMADGDELIRRGASGIDMDENADEQVLLLEDMAQEQRRQARSQPASPLQTDDDAEQKW